MLTERRDPDLCVSTQGIAVRSAWKRKPRCSVCSSLSLGKRFQSAPRYARCLEGGLAASASAAGWKQRSPDKSENSDRGNRGLLPAGTHPASEEIATLLAPRAEGLRFSHSTAVCCLPHYLQLKSFCSQFLCLVVEGGI